MKKSAVGKAELLCVKDILELVNEGMTVYEIVDKMDVKQADKALTVRQMYSLINRNDDLYSQYKLAQQTRMDRLRDLSLDALEFGVKVELAQLERGDDPQKVSGKFIFKALDALPEFKNNLQMLNNSKTVHIHGELTDDEKKQLDTLSL